MSRIEIISQPRAENAATVDQKARDLISEVASAVEIGPGECVEATIIANAVSAIIWESARTLQATEADVASAILIAFTTGQSRGLFADGAFKRGRA